MPTSVRVRVAILFPAVVTAFAAGAVVASAVRGPVPAGASEKTAADVYSMTAGGVVRIEVTRTAVGPTLVGPGRDVLEASGSGFVYDRDGRIVTNRHVVYGSSSVVVRFADGRHVAATYVAGDPDSDIAVLELQGRTRDIPPLRLGDSSTVEVGQPVVAIGSPFGLANSATSGIVSAVGRTIRSPDNSAVTGVIQTDAAINHGSSGGPLLDLDGRVIGVVSQFQSAAGGSDGVGLAVPANTVRTVVARLLSRRARAT